MEKRVIWGVIFLVCVGIVLLGVRLLSPEDTWLCQEGEWVKHGQPRVAKPTTECVRSDGTSLVATDQVRVLSPRANQSIFSPLEISGEARGNWFFEASFPVRLVDADNNVLAEGIATANGEWMTPEFVPFTAKLEFVPGAATTGKLILKKDNPSGLPENDAQVEVPIAFMPSEAQSQVKVFWGNNNLNPGAEDCAKVFETVRAVPRTTAVARAALEQLFLGVTEKETADGYFSLINPGVKIQKLTIENGVAAVDLSRELEDRIGGSCRVAAIRAQIVATLKQFPTVSEVIISIDGRSEDILQP